MADDLSGEVAVVTGVLGRLGSIWAGALREAGATVVGLDSRDHPGNTADPVSGNGASRYLGLRADVTDQGSIRRALDQCLERVGPPTILVNNAGIDQPPSAAAQSWRFEDVPEELSAVVLDVNALGVLRVCQIFGSAMIKQGHGSIVNIGSLYASVAPDPRMYDHPAMDPPFLKPPAYGMSKAALTALTRFLAVLWGPAGVRVNTLSPGGVLGDQDREFQEKFSSRVPLRRMATAADLIGPLLFLASDQSSYVTGAELVVDGGYLCW